MIDENRGKVFSVVRHHRADRGEKKAPEADLREVDSRR